MRRTPAAYAFVQALDQQLGPDASKIKRDEHIFADANDVADLMVTEGFVHVDVNTVTKLMATPMAGLPSDRNDVERDALGTRSDGIGAAERFCTFPLSL